ncbi:MAG: hypothetical protein K8F91_06225, partial [Candidatus Obscuribacterales bacterium]|nr:hypothetical protein [Candidatus Obscuribacterales bacterium]
SIIAFNTGTCLGCKHNLTKSKQAKSESGSICTQNYQASGNSADGTYSEKESSHHNHTVRS